MQSQIEFFLSLERCFQSSGHTLYMVGGTSRDFLLHKDLNDLDFATDANPDVVINLLPKVDKTFAQYGAFKYSDGKNKCDLLCFRLEGKYTDSRHPTKIKFTTDIKKDSKRRDFTINALYIDKKFNVIDFYGGKKDLDNNIIRFIGKPSKRIKEDPLRIIRAIRFSLVLGFDIEEKTMKACKKYAYLVGRLNPQKIKEELSKMKPVEKEDIKNKFDEFTISKYFEF